MRHTDSMDKIVLFLCCGLLSLIRPWGELYIVPVLVAVITIGLISYFNSLKIRLLAGAGYTFLCFFYPALCFFLPVIMYGYFERRYIYYTPLGLLPLVTAAEVAGTDRLLILMLAVISIIMKLKTLYFTQLRKKHLTLTDSAREMSMHLRKQNQMLMEKQDNEIRMATLNERNRIAREIHDNVGHQLSSALLQVGALLTTQSEDKALHSIKKTLNLAMDNIRNSVHNLYDTSIDLGLQLENIITNFKFCGINLNISIDTDPIPAVKYAIIAIVREALANIARHSDATQATLSFIEHPGFFQLIVSDNGHVKGYDMENGIGLKNITQRVEALDGHCIIRIKSGFELFITIPKEAAS